MGYQYDGTIRVDSSSKRKKYLRVVSS